MCSFIEAGVDAGLGLEGDLTGLLHLRARRHQVHPGALPEEVVHRLTDDMPRACPPVPSTGL